MFIFLCLGKRLLCVFIFELNIYEIFNLIIYCFKVIGIMYGKWEIVIIKVICSYWDDGSV